MNGNHRPLFSFVQRVQTFLESGESDRRLAGFLVIHFLLLTVLIAFMASWFSLPWDQPARLLRIWDVEWYLDLKAHGYFLIPGRKSSIAFFPLFPWLWRILGWHPLVMAVLSAGFWLTGVLLLKKYFKVENAPFFLALSVPSAFFFYIPYTEALFGLLLVWIVIAYERNRPAWLFSGALIAGITKSTCMLFLPIAVCMWILYQSKAPSFPWKKWLALVGGTLGGLVIVTWVQYMQTGAVAPFLGAQKAWDRYWQIPELPFLGGASDKAVRLDSAAWLCGLSALFMILMNYLNKLSFPEPRDALRIALLYLGGMALLMTLRGGGDFSALNRYMLATPFFMLLLTMVYRAVPFSYRFFFVVLIGFNLLYLAFGNYVSVKLFIYYFSISLFLAGFLWLRHPSPVLRVLTFTALYLINLTLQAYYLLCFLDNQWVG